MADTYAKNLMKQLSGLTRLPAHSQFGLVVGLAVVIALAVTVVLWAAKKPMRPIPGLSGNEVAEAVTVLEQQNIEYEIGSNGQLLVARSDFPLAQMQLNMEGLTAEVRGGYEDLGTGGGLGESAERERTRLHSMRETELERMIMTFDVVRAARVTLGIPRSTGFLRSSARPTASVVVTLHPGRQLDDQQVAGIVASVASGVAELDPDAVTVADQRGRLLSGGDNFDTVGGANRQLDYKQQIEETHVSKIRELLGSFVGADRMSVSVSADIDFTQTESTIENYDAADPVVISEQLSEEQVQGAPLGGVPGALSNQPPAEAVVADAAAGAEVAQQNAPTTRRTSSSRNFEVGRTIDHVRQFSPTINRLTAAVVVDHQQVIDDSGEATLVPRSEADMEVIRGLVREAIGFNEARGDTVIVQNAAFIEPEAPEAVPDAPVWQQPWVMDLVRYGAGAIGVLMLMMLVIRPVLKSLAQVPARPLMAPALPEGAMGADGVMLAPGQAGMNRGASSQAQLGRARQLANEDPKLAAQVVRSWISNDGK